MRLRYVREDVTMGDGKCLVGDDVLRDSGRQGPYWGEEAVLGRWGEGLYYGREFTIEMHGKRKWIGMVEGT